MIEKQKRYSAVRYFLRRAFQHTFYAVDRGRKPAICIYQFRAGHSHSFGDQKSSAQEILRKWKSDNGGEGVQLVVEIEVIFSA
jgi:hypothetical protein